MTGNVIFLGFWFVAHSGVDMTAAVVAFGSFLAGTVLGGRFARHLEHGSQAGQGSGRSCATRWS